MENILNNQDFFEIYKRDLNSKTKSKITKHKYSSQMQEDINRKDISAEHNLSLPPDRIGGLNCCRLLGHLNYYRGENFVIFKNIWGTQKIVFLITRHAYGKRLVCNVYACNSLNCNDQTLALQRP